jgi:hypothetical protein
MPEAPNKFARMIQTAREHQARSSEETPEIAPEEQPPPKTAPPARPPAPKGRGRPATGKRSDPDYESTTVFLRKDTKTAAARLLIGEKHQDLSDVLEKLLSGWVRKNS